MSTSNSSESSSEDDLTFTTERLVNILKHTITTIEQVSEIGSTNYSFLRCILYSKSVAYNTGFINFNSRTLKGNRLTDVGVQQTSKETLIRELARELRQNFTIERYNSLLGGSLAASSKRRNGYDKLRKSFSVLAFGLQEYISDVLDVDVYILHNNCILDAGEDHHQYYHKGRSSIIVYYDGSCFHSVGVRKNGDYHFLFEAGGTTIRRLLRLI